MKKLIDPEHFEYLYPLAKSLLIERQSASVSLLQRHFKIGYRRALDLMDLLENDGVVTELSLDGTRDLKVQTSS